MSRRKVHVAVRCRPRFHYGAEVNFHEQEAPDSKTHERTSLPRSMIETQASVSSEESCVEFNENLHTVRVREKMFAVDTVIPPSATQKDVFERLVQPMISEALNGIHTTIFAYGQTGSGKTHTMEGYKYTPMGTYAVRANFSNTSKDDLGIIPRSIEALFQQVEDATRRNGRLFKIKCSYYQIYNEKVIDLLNPASTSLALMSSAGPQRPKGPGSGAVTNGLRVRWVKHDRFYVENLFIFECENVGQVLELFQLGVKNKCMASHHMNYQSSRSHCIFTLYLTQWNNPEAFDDGGVITSEITLVDLAGSEKLSLLSKNPSPQLLQESIDINTSLLALGKVVTALAEQSEQQDMRRNIHDSEIPVTGITSHVPYRDSKLTRLLKHALGGNSVTLMIACINPCEAYAEETLSTLYYAGRARNITNEPKVNEDAQSALVRALRAEIQSLKLELQHTRGVFASNPEAISPPQNVYAGDVRVRSPSTHTRDDATLNQEVSVPREVQEKVYQSVVVVQELVDANAKLRSAFDQLLDKKQQAEQQVAALNHENMELRERIEVLESGRATELGVKNMRARDLHHPRSIGAHRSRSEPSTRERYRVRQKKYMSPTVGSRHSATLHRKETTSDRRSASTGARRYTPHRYPTSMRSSVESSIGPKWREGIRRSSPPTRSLIGHSERRRSSPNSRFTGFQQTSASPIAMGHTRNSYPAQRINGGAVENEGQGKESHRERSAPSSSHDNTPLSAVALAALRRVAGADGKSSPLLFCGTSNEVEILEERRRQRHARAEMLRQQHDRLLLGSLQPPVDITSSVGHPVELSSQSKTVTSTEALRLNADISRVLPMHPTTNVTVPNNFAPLHKDKECISVEKGTFSNALIAPPAPKSVTQPFRKDDPSPLPGTLAGFQYLNLEESKRRFTEEQLAVLTASQQLEFSRPTKR